MKVTFTMDFGKLSDDKAEQLIQDFARAVGWNPDDPDETRSEAEAGAEAIDAFIRNEARLYRKQVAAEETKQQVDQELDAVAPEITSTAKIK